MGFNLVPVRENPVLSSLSLTGNRDIVSFARFYSLIVVTIQLQKRVGGFGS